MKTDLVNLIFNNYKAWTILTLLKPIRLVYLKISLINTIELNRYFETYIFMIYNYLMIFLNTLILFWTKYFKYIPDLKSGWILNNF